MADYTLAVIGCDDRTTVDLALSADEHRVLEMIARAVNEKSNSGCQPTMKLEKRQG